MPHSKPSKQVLGSYPTELPMRKAAVWFMPRNSTSKRGVRHSYYAVKP